MNACLRIVCVILFTSIGRSASAQAPVDLSNQLPAKTLACIDWAGADAWRDSLQGAVVGRTMAEPDVKVFVDLAIRELTDSLRRRIVQQGGPAAQLGEPLIQFGGTLWRRPWAVVLLEPPAGDAGVQLGFVMKPGGDMAAVKQLVERMISLMKKAEVAVTPLGESGEHAKWSTLQVAPDSPFVAWCFSGEHFALAVGKSAAEALAASLAGGSHLSDQADYKAVIEGLAAPGPGRIVTLFGDTKRIGQLAAGADAGAQLIARTLGVDGIVAIGGSLALDGDGYRSAAYLHAPGARRGLMRLFDAKPVGDETFMLVPKDALFAYAGNVNLKALVGDAGASSMPADGLPINPLMLIPATRAAAPAVGELTAAIGNSWCIFLTPDAAGVSLLGLTASVDVKDEERAKRALGRLVEAVDESGGEGALRVRTARMGGQQVSYVHARERAMPIAPAWGVTRGRLVLALYPQNVASMLARLESGASRETSILANPAFIAGRKQLPDNAGAMAYYDTPGSMGRLYDVALPMLQTWLSSVPGGTGALDMASLPSRGSVTKHLFAGMSATCVDERGVLMVTRASLPLVNPSLAEAMVVGPALAGMAMPMMTRAESAADRQKSMRRLKDIGMACQTYAQEHEDQMPASLEVLTPYLRSSEGLSDCIMVTGYPPLSRITHPAERVVMYEKPQRYNHMGTCVLYADGHVQWRAMQAFQGDLRSTQEYLKKP